MVTDSCFEELLVEAEAENEELRRENERLTAKLSEAEASIADATRRLNVLEEERKSRLGVPGVKSNGVAAPKNYEQDYKTFAEVRAQLEREYLKQQRVRYR